MWGQAGLFWEEPTQDKTSYHQFSLLICYSLIVALPQSNDLTLFFADSPGSFTVPYLISPFRLHTLFPRYNAFPASPVTPPPLGVLLQLLVRQSMLLFHT